MDPATRARLFHAQYQEYDEDIPFWSALAHETGGSILEMGCGTGRLACALATKGYHVLGVDQDAAMLEMAKKRTDTSICGNVTWMKADITSFTWEKPIHLAIGALNTFAYLNDAQFCSAIMAARSILCRQGLIGLDLPPLDGDFLSADEEDTLLDVFDDSDSGNSIEVRANVLSKQMGQVDVAWIYDELSSYGTIKRHIWEQTYFMRSEDDLHRLSRKCGLSIRAIYGDYQFSPYKPNSHRLLVVMEK